MAQYVNENFVRKNKGLKENILKKNPVPRNFEPVKILDPSLAKIVKSRQDILADKDLEAVQSKSQRCLGSNMQIVDNHWKSNSTEKLRGKRRSSFFGTHC